MVIDVSWAAEGRRLEKQSVFQCSMHTEFSVKFGVFFFPFNKSPAVVVLHIKSYGISFKKTYGIA